MDLKKKKKKKLNGVIFINMKRYVVEMQLSKAAIVMKYNSKESYRFTYNYNII